MTHIDKMGDLPRLGLPRWLRPGLPLNTLTRPCPAARHLRESWSYWCWTQGMDGNGEMGLLKNSYYGSFPDSLLSAPVSSDAPR